MVKKELVELFTTSEKLRGVLESELAAGTVTGKQNPPQMLTPPMYSFSDLPETQLMKYLRKINPHLAPADNYEVRSIEMPHPGRYVALRRDGVLATDEDDISRIIRSNSAS